MATNTCLFSGCAIYIIPKLIGSKRYQLFKNHIIKNGGIVCEKDDFSLSHVVCDEEISPDDPDIRYFQSLERPFKIVGTKWLSECIKSNILASVEGFQLDALSCNAKPLHEKRKIQANKLESPPKQAKKDDHVANQSILDSQNPINSKLVEELSQLGKSYQSLGDRYRSRNYFGAVSVIQKYPKQIESYEEALSIPGITPRMASKIGEIIETGSLRRTVELTGNEKVKTVELFTKIWGVGPATADNWFQQGHRSLDDVKNKCNLNKMQHIGIKYFDDFQKPIPRTEVETICAKVTEAAQSIDPTIKTEICGSYRRGKFLCGDIDIVIFEHSEDHSHLMGKLLKTLTNSGLLCDEFSSLEAAKHHKFLGICKLPGEDEVFRRLDIFIVPFREYAPAMIHYTGSATFNVALRQYAIRKGMHLSENGLFDKVVRDGKLVITGDALVTPTEESVFHLLGVPYRGPEDRETLIVKEIEKERH